MLIRSQRKRSIINVERMESFGIANDNEIKAYVGDGWYLLGEYSTEEKSIKVLDMIQEAYARCESVKALSSGIMFEVTERIRNQEKAEDFKNEHRATFVFQMPQDSEV